jgi:transcriptional regulator GlxA family with amidase domain
MDLASGLLRTTNLGVAEIAERVGYDSEAAFSRAFKRAFGKAPAHWRMGSLTTADGHRLDARVVPT